MDQTTDSLLKVISPLINHVDKELINLINRISHLQNLIEGQSVLPTESTALPPFPPAWRNPAVLRDPYAFTITRLNEYVDGCGWNLVKRGNYQASHKYKNNKENTHIELHNRYEVLSETAPDEPQFKINYKTGDVLSNIGNASLVHCVAKDLKMGRGIAKDIKNKFGHVKYLKCQNKCEGEVATLPLSPENFIFYLITKPVSKTPPINDNYLKICLRELKKLCYQLDIKHLVMPKIASNNDKMLWCDVEKLIIDCFSDTDIIIDVYTIVEATNSYHSQQSQEKAARNSKKRSAGWQRKAKRTGKQQATEQPDTLLTPPQGACDDTTHHTRTPEISTLDNETSHQTSITGEREQNVTLCTNVSGILNVNRSEVLDEGNDNDSHDSFWSLDDNEQGTGSLLESMLQSSTSTDMNSAGPSNENDETLTESISILHTPSHRPMTRSSARASSIFANNKAPTCATQLFADNKSKVFNYSNKNKSQTKQKNYEKLDKKQLPQKKSPIFQTRKTVNQKL